MDRERHAQDAQNQTWRTRNQMLQEGTAAAAAHTSAMTGTHKSAQELADTNQGLGQYSTLLQNLPDVVVTKAQLDKGAAERDALDYDAVLAAIPDEVHTRAVFTRDTAAASTYDAAAHAEALRAVPDKVSTSADFDTGVATAKVSAWKRILDSVPRKVTTHAQMESSGMAAGAMERALTPGQSRGAVDLTDVTRATSETRQLGQAQQDLDRKQTKLHVDSGDVDTASRKTKSAGSDAEGFAAKWEQAGKRFVAAWRPFESAVSTAFGAARSSSSSAASEVEGHWRSSVARIRGYFSSLGGSSGGLFTSLVSSAGGAARALAGGFGLMSAGIAAVIQLLPALSAGLGAVGSLLAAAPNLLVTAAAGFAMFKSAIEPVISALGAYSKVLNQQQAVQANPLQAQQAQAQLNRQVADAYYAVQEASFQARQSQVNDAHAVADAQYNLAQAVVQAANQQKVAAHSVADAQHAVREAVYSAQTTSIQDAHAVANAQYDLSQAVFQSGQEQIHSAHDVAEAQYSLREADFQASQTRITDAHNVAESQYNLTRSQVSAALQQEQAVMSVETALHSYQDSVFNVTQAQFSLTMAWEQANFQLKQLELTVSGASLDLRGAQLQLLQAQQSYAQVMAQSTSTALDRAQAAYQIQVAEQNLKQVSLSNAQNEQKLADVRKFGANQVFGVVAAQHALTDAQFAAAQAQKSVAITEKQAAEAQIQSAHAIKDAVFSLRQALVGQAHDAITSAHSQADAQYGLSQAFVSAAQSRITSAHSISEAQFALWMAERTQGHDRLSSIHAEGDAVFALGQAIFEQSQGRISAAHAISDAQFAMSSAYITQAHDRVSSAHTEQSAQSQLQAALAASKEAAMAGGPMMVGVWQALNTALSQLSPSARRAVKDLEPLLAWWNDNQKAQEAFFSIVEPGMRKIGTLVGPLNDMLDAMATSAGYVAREFLDWFLKLAHSPAWKVLTQANADIVFKLGDALFHVVKAFTEIAVVAAPFTEWLVNEVDKLAKRFDNWAAAQERAGAKGSFAKWLKDSEPALKAIGHLVESVMFFFEILAGGSPKFNSKGVLVGVLPSPNEQRNLQSFIILISTLSNQVLPDLALILTSLAKPQMADAISKLLGALTQLILTVVSSPGFQATFTAVLSLLSWLVNILGDAAKLPGGGTAIGAIIGGIFAVITAEKLASLLHLTGTLSKLFGVMSKIKGLGRITDAIGSIFGWSPGGAAGGAAAKGMQGAGDTMLTASANMQRAADTMVGASGEASAAGGESAAGGAAAGKGASGFMGRIMATSGVGNMLLGAGVGAGIAYALGHLAAGMAPPATAAERRNYNQQTPGFAQAVPNFFLGKEGAQNVSGFFQHSVAHTPFQNGGGFDPEVVFKKIGDWFSQSWPHFFTKSVPGAFDWVEHKFDQWRGPVRKWFAGPFVDFFTQAIPNAWGWIERRWPGAVAAVKHWFAGPFVHFFTEAVPKAFGWLGGHFMGAVHAVGHWFAHDFVDFFTQAVPKAFGWVGGHFMGAVRAVGHWFAHDFVDFFTKAVPGAFGWVWGHFWNMVKGVAHWFAHDFVDFFTQAVPKAFHWIGGVFSGAVSGIGHWFAHNFVDFFTQSVPKAFSWVWGIFDTNVVQPITNFFTKTMPDFFTKTIPNAAAKVGGGALNFGKSVLHAIGIPGFAGGTGEGGAKPGWAWVGEAGGKGELVHFTGGEVVLSHEQSMRVASQAQGRGYAHGTAPVPPFIGYAAGTLGPMAVPGLNVDIGGPMISSFDKVHRAFRDKVQSPLAVAAVQIGQDMQRRSQQWFDEVPTHFGKQVAAPIGQWISQGSQQQFNKALPGWFDSVHPLFKKQVDTPISTWITQTVPGHYDKTIPHWYDKAHPTFTKNVDQPITKWVTRTNLDDHHRTQGHWYDPVVGHFTAQVNQPVTKWVTQTNLQDHHRTQAHWYDPVWGWWQNKVAGPIGHYVSNTLPHDTEAGFKSSTNWVIGNVINKVVDYINKITGGVGGGKVSHVPGLAVGGNVPGFSSMPGRGSVGGAGDEDSQPTYLTPGEWVLRKPARMTLERHIGVQGLNWLNNADKYMGYAGGGEVAGGGGLPIGPVLYSAGGAVSSSGVSGYAGGGGVDRSPFLGWRPGRDRIDQGVDYTGSGPIGAIDSGTITGLLGGWPGGPYIRQALDAGRFAGKAVYYAENLSSRVHAGQHVAAGQHIADMSGGVEFGFAGPNGSQSMASFMHQVVGGIGAGERSTAFGMLFNQWMQSLGVPGGIVEGPVSGKVPANWPGAGFGPATFGPAAIKTFFQMFGQGAGGLNEGALLKQMGSGTWDFSKLWDKTVGALAAHDGVWPGNGLVPDMMWTMMKGIKDKVNSELQAAGGSSGPASPGVATVARFLMAHGFTRAAAAGIAGTVAGESGGNPESVGSGGGGLIGWTPISSAYPIKNIITGNARVDMGNQLTDMLAYIQHNGSIADLNRFTDPMAAAWHFSQQYERPLVTGSDIRASVVHALYAQGLASGGEVYNTLRGAVGSAANAGPLSEAMLYGSWIESQWNSTFARNKRHGLFGIPEGTVDPKTKKPMTTQHMDDMTYAAKFMLPRYQHDLSLSAFKRNPKGASDSAAWHADYRKTSYDTLFGAKYLNEGWSDVLKATANPGGPTKPMDTTQAWERAAKQLQLWLGYDAKHVKILQDAKPRASMPHWMHKYYDSDKKLLAADEAAITKDSKFLGGDAAKYTVPQWQTLNKDIGKLWSNLHHWNALKRGNPVDDRIATQMTDTLRGVDTSAYSAWLAQYGPDGATPGGGVKQVSGAGGSFGAGAGAALSVPPDLQLLIPGGPMAGSFGVDPGNTGIQALDDGGDVMALAMAGGGSVADVYKMFTGGMNPGGMMVHHNFDRVPPGILRAMAAHERNDSRQLQRQVSDAVSRIGVQVQGGITVNNPVPERAGSSISHAVNRLSFLAGRGES